MRKYPVVSDERCRHRRKEVVADPPEAIAPPNPQMQVPDEEDAAETEATDTEMIEAKATETEATAGETGIKTGITATSFETAMIEATGTEATGTEATGTEATGTEAAETAMVAEVIAATGVVGVTETRGASEAIGIGRRDGSVAGKALRRRRIARSRS